MVFGSEISSTDTLSFSLSQDLSEIFRAYLFSFLSTLQQQRQIPPWGTHRMIDQLTFRLLPPPLIQIQLDIQTHRVYAHMHTSQFETSTLENPEIELVIFNYCYS